MICAGASMYLVYNVERFKRLYELQVLNPPDRDPSAVGPSNP
jgi:hypothetical protein